MDKTNESRAVHDLLQKNHIKPADDGTTRVTIICAVVAPLFIVGRNIDFFFQLNRCGNVLDCELLRRRNIVHLGDPDSGLDRALPAVVAGFALHRGLVADGAAKRTDHDCQSRYLCLWADYPTTSNLISLLFGIGLIERLGTELNIAATLCDGSCHTAHQELCRLSIFLVRSDVPSRHRLRSCDETLCRIRFAFVNQLNDLDDKPGRALSAQDFGAQKRQCRDHQ